MSNKSGVFAKRGWPAGDGDSDTAKYSAFRRQLLQIALDLLDSFNREAACHVLSMWQRNVVLPQVWICPTQRRPAAPVPADADRSQVEVAAILDTLPCVQAILGAAGQQLGKSRRLLATLRPALNPHSRFDFGKFAGLQEAAKWQAKEGLIRETA